MPDEFEKRIDLVCVATGLKPEEKPDSKSAPNLDFLSAVREDYTRRNEDPVSRNSLWDVLYSSTIEKVQSVPLPPVSVPVSDFSMMLAQLPPGVDPQSVTAVLYSGTPPTATEVNVTFDRRSPVEGLNIFLKEDIVGDYLVYIYFYNTSDTYLINSNLQLRYKVDANFRLRE